MPDVDLGPLFCSLGGPEGAGQAEGQAGGFFQGGGYSLVDRNSWYALVESHAGGSAL